ncbi:MAG: hypothetical protein HQK65_12270 [Desulfamplus sp.]|nr:hypothetical protein [Desulfamplus sp.]
MFDLIPYDHNGNLPAIIDSKEEPLILPEETFRNLDVTILLDTKTARRLKIISVKLKSENSDQNEEFNQESGEWKDLEQPGFNSFKLSCNKAGLHEVVFEVDYGEHCIKYRKTFFVHDFQMISIGHWFNASETSKMYFLANRSFIEIFCKESNRHLGFLPTMPGEWIVDMTTLENYVIVLSQNGFIHLWSLQNFSRKSYRLTNASTLNGNLLAHQDDTFTFQQDRGNAWRLKITHGDIKKIESIRPYSSPSFYLHDLFDDKIISKILELKNITDTLKLKVIRLSQSQGKDHSCIALLPGGGVSAYILSINSGMVTRLIKSDINISLTSTLRLSNNYSYAIFKKTLVTNNYTNFACVQEHSMSLTGEFLNVELINNFSTALYIRDDKSWVHAASNDKGTVVLTGGKTERESTTLFTFQPHEAHMCKSIPTGEQTFSADVYIFFLPTGHLVTGGMDLKLKCHNIDRNTLQSTLTWSICLDSNLQDCCIDNRGLLIVTTPSVIYIIDPTEGVIIDCNDICSNSHLDAVAYSNENDQILVGDWDGYIYILNKRLKIQKKTKVFNNSIFNIVTLAKKRAWVITEENQAHLIDWSGNAVSLVGTLNHFEMKFRRRRAMDCFIGSSLVFLGDSDMHYPRSKFLFPIKNITVTHDSQICLTPLNKLLASYKPILDEKEV